MIVKPFFANPLLAWMFFSVLIALLSVAAVIDLRHVIVPKWLSLTILALGVAFNVARGAYLGSGDHEVWTFYPGGPWVGAADGFVFALAGFAAGFAIFFFLWIAGGCGGGDVKIFAATSAWVGPWIAVWILVLSTIILIALVFGRSALKLLQDASQHPAALAVDRKNRKSTTGAVPSSRGMTYSLPLALATCLALLWLFRFDLNLTKPRPEDRTAQINSDWLKRCA